MYVCTYSMYVHAVCMFIQYVCSYTYSIVHNDIMAYIHTYIHASKDTYVLYEPLIPKDLSISTTLPMLVLCISGTVLSSNSFW